MSWWSELWDVSKDAAESKPSEEETAPLPPLVWALQVAEDANAGLREKNARLQADLDRMHEELIQACAVADELRGKLGAINHEKRQWEKLNGEVRWLRARLGMPTTG